MATFGIILLSFILSIYFYHQMPDKMASHWNAQGEVDGCISKHWGLFSIPIILLGLAFFFFAIPRIDPLRGNIEKFIKYYDRFVFLLFVFMLSIQFQVILWNIGVKLSPNIILPIGSGLLFFYLGILCENARRNWFIGIRTPWTLSSERVWEKTHKIGGKLLKVAGVFVLIGGVFRSYALFFILVPITLVVAYIIIYSYFEYQKEVKS